MSKSSLIKTIKVFCLIDPPANISSTWLFLCMYHIYTYVFIITQSSNSVFQTTIAQANFYSHSLSMNKQKLSHTGDISKSDELQS